MDVFGLPLHPLVVHGAVVLVPLAALGAIAVLLSSWVRQRYGWLTAALALAGAGAAIVARLSGEALAQSLGGGGQAIATHRMWGQWAPSPAILLALALTAALVFEQRSKVGWWVSALLALVGAVAGLVLIVLTGHSGATSVWGS